MNQVNEFKIESSTTSPVSYGTDFVSDRTEAIIVYRDPKILKPHPLLIERNFQMPAEQEQAFQWDIQVRGVVDPIHVNENNEILDGVTRANAAILVGLRLVPLRVFRFKCKEDENIHVLQANLMRKALPTQYRYLNIADISEQFELGRGGRREKGSKEAAAASLPESEESDVLEKTSNHIGVSPTTVKIARRYKRELTGFEQFFDMSPNKFLDNIVQFKKLSDETLRDLMMIEAKTLSEKKAEELFLISTQGDVLLLQATSDTSRDEARSYFINCVADEIEPDMNRVREIAVPTQSPPSGDGKDDLENNGGGTNPSSGGESEVKDKIEKFCERLVKKKTLIDETFESIADIILSIDKIRMEDEIGTMNELKSRYPLLKNFSDWLPSASDSITKMRTRLETEDTYLQSIGIEELSAGMRK